MRPYATLGLLLSLTACSVVDDGIGSVFGNPADGWLDFVGDTVSFKSNPNRPEPESDTIRRAMGQDVQTEPLVSETGNIWPVMPRQEPTMQELQRAPAPMAAVAPARAVGSSSPPAPVNVVPAVVAAPVMAAPAPRIAPAPLASGTALPTPNGNAILTAGQNGILSYTLPSGASGRAIDNGNGTMTLIGADGQVMSVPAPR